VTTKQALVFQFEKTKQALVFAVFVALLVSMANCALFNATNQESAIVLLLALTTKKEPI